MFSSIYLKQRYITVLMDHVHKLNSTFTESINKEILLMQIRS